MDLSDLVAFSIAALFLIELAALVGVALWVIQ